jgi:hypothetical protein
LLLLLRLQNVLLQEGTSSWDAATTALSVGVAVYPLPTGRSFHVHWSIPGSKTVAAVGVVAAAAAIANVLLNNALLHE